MNAIILDFVAAQRRAACPLQAPRLVGALVGVACLWAALPLHVACAAVAGYHAVLTGEGRP